MSDFLADLWGLTVSDVESVTGVTVDAATLQQAAEVIEPYVNRTAAASGGMLKRDIRWIKKAICHQAGWMPDQPGYSARQNVTRVSQDGQVIDFTPAASDTAREYAVTLAPMAARALKNLSWKASRSMRVPRDTNRNANLAASGFLVSDAYHDTFGWERL